MQKILLIEHFILEIAKLIIINKKLNKNKNKKIKAKN